MKRKRSFQPAIRKPEPLWKGHWPYFFLTLLAFGVYANSLGNGFVSDDHFQLLGNPLVTDWRHIPDILRHDLWALVGGLKSNYYRPILGLVYLGLHGLFGFDPLAFHLVQVLIHAANTLLVFVLALHLLKSANAALVAGVVFAVHPIHTEPVDWIAALPDVMLTLIALIAFLLFEACEAAPRGRKLVELTLLYFLALLIKEPGVMLFPLFVAYEIVYLLRPFRQVVLRNGMFYAALTCAFGGYMLLRFHALGGVAPAQGLHHNLEGMVFFLSLIRTLGEYLSLLIVPRHLNYFRYFEPTTTFSFAFVASLAAALFTIGAIFMLRNRTNPQFRTAGFGLLLLLTTLLPALNLNGLGENVVAERYLYLPSVGFVLAVAAAWEWLGKRQAVFASALILIAAVLSSSVVIVRNSMWRNDEQLLTASIALSPNTLQPISDLGTYYYMQGNYRGAIERYQQALKLAPEDFEMHRNLGNAYERNGAYSEAAAELRMAVRLEPNDPDSHRSLGLALDQLGDLDSAAAEDERAIQLRPGFPEALADLAFVRMGQHDFNAAIVLLQRSLALKYRNFEAWFNLGIAYSNIGQFQGAVEPLQKAIEIASADNPNVFRAHFQLGIAYANMNLAQQAVREFKATLDLNPDFAPAKEALNMSERTTVPLPPSSSQFLP